jgi:hypothetical protein
VSFDPLNGEFFMGESCPPEPDTFSVAIVIDETPTPVKGFKFVFEFDATLMQPIDALPGELLIESGYPWFFSWTNAADTLVADPDSVQIDAAVLGGTFVGPGVLGRIGFIMLDIGESDLAWRSLVFRDEDNYEITVGSVDGTVLIDVCPVPVTPTTWGHIKARSSFKPDAVVERR